MLAHTSFVKLCGSIALPAIALSSCPRTARATEALDPAADHDRGTEARDPQQQRPYWAPPPSSGTWIPVLIEGNPRTLELELVRVGEGWSMAECRGACWTYAYSGDYVLKVDRGGQDEPSERKLTLEGPSHLLVEPPQSDGKGLGLALGIGGIVAIPVGFMMMLPTLLGSSGLCHDYGGCTSPAERALGLAGLGLVIGGSVSIPVGWGMYRRATRPSIEISPLP